MGFAELNTATNTKEIDKKLATLIAAQNRTNELLERLCAILAPPAASVLT